MNQYVSQGVFDRRVKLIEEKLKHISDNDLLNRLQAEHDFFVEQLRNTELNLEELIEQIEKSGGNTNQKLNDLINSYNNFKANTLRINDVFDADGQFDGSRIRPLSVETAALTVGQRSQQLALNGIEFKLDPYATSGGGVLKWRSTSNSSSPNTNNIAGLMFHYGYGTNTDPKIYLIYEGSHSFTSNDTSKGFYIYAVISKASSYIYTEPSTVSEEYFNGYFELLYDNNYTKIYNNTLPSFDSTKEYYIEVNDKKEEIIINEENFRKNLVGLYYKNGDTYSLVLMNKPTYSSTTKYCTKKSNDIPAENGSSTTYNGETISYNNTAAILVTADKIPSEGDNTHTDGLYIQLGYISVELSAGNTNNPFYRKVDMTYGQTTINGRLITTGRIEGNGAYFDLDKGEIGGKIIFKSGNNTYNTIDSYLQSKYNDILSYVDTNSSFVDAIGNLQDQIDGAIDTWFYDGEPTLNNEPAVNWTDNIEKSKHIGDLYYDDITGYGYRFAYDETVSPAVYKWLRITDTDVVKALADAAKAQDTADHKRRVFITNENELPPVPYDVGDLWSNATYANGGVTYYRNCLLRCKTARASGATANISDWQDSSRATETADLSLAQVEAAKSELLAIENGTTTIAGGMITNNLLELKNIVGVTKQFKNFVEGRSYYKRISNKTVNNNVIKRFLEVTISGTTYPNYNLYEIAQQGDINTIDGIIVQNESATTGTSATFKATEFYYGGGEPGLVTAGLSGIEDFPCYWSGGDEVLAKNYILFKNAYHYYDNEPYPSYLNTRTTWFNSYDDFIFDFTWDTQVPTKPKFSGTRREFHDAVKIFDTLKRNYDGVVDQDSDIPRLPVVIIDFDGFCKFGDFYIYNSQAYYNNASGFGHYALTLNGQQNGSGTSLGSFYAPTGPGIQNQLLVADSSGIPSWKATAGGAAYATSINGALTFGTLPIAQGGTGNTTGTATYATTTTDTSNTLYPVGVTSGATTTLKRDTSITMAGGALTGITSITTTGGNGFLSYKPGSWTGVSSSQWGVGTIDIQGVIRSSNTDLLHSRNGTNSVILDASNYNSYSPTLTGTGASGTWGINITGNANTIDNYDSTSLFRELAYSTATNLDANNMTDNMVLYRTGNVDMNTWGTTTFANFPTNRPDGGFALLNINEGTYQKQFYSCYNNPNLYIRYRYYDGGRVWSSWYTSLNSNNYSSYALPLSGGTMTGLITTKTGATHTGIKFANAYITALNNDVIFQNNNAIRFGADDWDYNKWAGLKYDSTNKIVYLGLADGTVFTANTAQTNGVLALPGIRYFNVNGKRVIDAGDAWLRINENNAYSSGIYFGSSVVKTDGTLQVGSGGSAFYANSSGNGYFSGVLKSGAYCGDDSGFVVLPKGGYYKTNTQNVTGAIKIKLPKKYTSHMLSFWVDVYNYNEDNDLTSYFVSGYNYGVNNTWYYCSARCIGSGTHSNLTVRFGDDGTNCCVTIGETTTTWKYPQVTVRDVQFGYGNTDYDLAKDWGISFVTTLPTNINKTIDTYTLWVKTGIWSSGYISALGQNSSDKRLKKEIKPFNAKQIIDKLSPVEFEWNKKANKYNSNLELNKKNYGLIAQDSDGIIDNLVFDLPDGKGYKGVRYEKLIPILLQAVKEQQKEIDELKKLIKK